MYQFLHNILQDQTYEPRFTMYDPWHILYLVLLFASIGLTVLLLRKRDTHVKKKAIAWSLNIAFSLYMADLFIMPFSQGCIDVDKLPFHICTLMSILCFFSRHNEFMGRFQSTFALMGLIGGLIYVFCPSGVATGEVSIFCYRILQTLTFHGLMIGYGVYSIAFDDIKFRLRDCGRDALIIAITIVWALIGNNLYEGLEGRTFNWCFVSSDPLGIIPQSVAMYVMPFVVFSIIFFSTLLIRLFYHIIRKKIANKA